MLTNIIFNRNKTNIKPVLKFKSNMRPTHLEPKKNTSQPIDTDKLNIQPLNTDKLNIQPLNSEQINIQPLNSEQINIPEIFSKPKNRQLENNCVINTTIYIISDIKGGGSKKYLDDITNHYTNIPITYIKTKEVLLNTIFLQHLLYTDIFPNDINSIKQKYNIKIIISIHDFYWIIPNMLNIEPLLHILPENPYYENIYLNLPSRIHPSIVTMFDTASIVIHPSLFTKKYFDEFFRKDNTIIQYHNDIKIDYTTKKIPKIINNQINIGHFQPFTPYKGSDFVNLLLNKYQNYKGYRINFLILEKNIPSYEEITWHEKMEEYNFHCLLHLNKYGETYSYALSKSINSGLPILYNNIGSLQERLPEKDHYIKVYNIEDEMENEEILYHQFETMLDYIILNNGLFNTYNSSTTIEYKDIYNYIFDNQSVPQMNNLIHNKIKPFAVYFPHFHTIPEYNKNYYIGMTDTVNLNHYIENYKKPNEILDTPCLETLEISNILNYNLTNKTIINKQIEIAKKFSIYGFACYYYWFSENTITNQHTIFEKCYDLFFQEEVDFKIYFIWANEDWTNNSAFNVKTEKIINLYNFDNFIKNINNLIKYFKHPNYYKIDNKPVFFVHHPWHIKEDELFMFNYLLDIECIKHGFNGAILHVNNMMNTMLDYKMYNFSPSYKGGESTNYYKYTETVIKPQIKNKNINTLFFDFNNSARFSIPYKPNLVTVFSNNTIYNQDYLINSILTIYKEKRNESDKILLINSWNEWGENMAIEPGEINKTKYLSLIKSNLLSFIP